MLASDWLKELFLFAWFAVSSSLGYAYTMGTLRGSALVIGFDCGALLILIPSWFTSWSFFWPTSLTVTLGGTAGEFAFLNIYRLGSSMLPCVHDLILLKGLQVLYSVVHRLDIVWRDKLHPWKTSVAYNCFWGGFYCV